MNVTLTPQREGRDLLRGTLNRLENLLVHSTAQTFSPGYWTTLGAALHELHARVRAHHAASRLSESEDGTLIAPDYLDALTCLSKEHNHLLGMLDRQVRLVDSMVDRQVEDRDVFFLSVRELIAVLRRHEAQEDRLFALSMWRDTGGES